MKKKLNKRGLLFGALFCVAALIIGGTIVYKRQTCVEPECFLVRTLRGYKKVDVYQDTDRAFSALLKKEQNQLRIEAWLDIERLEADAIIKNHTVRMYTLYEKAVSPYPGEISNAISCAQEYRPTYTADQTGGRETHLFTGFANDRLSFGACAEDLITNRAAVAMFYCGQQKRLYKLELFSPIGGPAGKFNEEAGKIRFMPCE